MTLRGALIFLIKNCLLIEQLKRLALQKRKWQMSLLSKNYLWSFIFDMKKIFAQIYGNEKETNSKLTQIFRFCACVHLLYWIHAKLVTRIFFLLLLRYSRGIYCYGGNESENLFIMFNLVISFWSSFFYQINCSPDL